MAQRLRTASAIALFLDFDGTLSSLCPRPEDVQLSGAMRHIVSTLSRKPRVRVWVISGRRRNDVFSRIRIAGIHYLGLHGWEGPNGVTIKKDTCRLLERVKAQARETVEAIPATWLEDKGFVVAIHHANASPCDVQRIRQEMTRVLLPLNGLFRGIPGERTFELAPAEMGDKGSAVRHELALGYREALPVFIGDDAVDEPAFAALTKGITIRVGHPDHTRAHFRLSGVRQVRMFLERLNQER